MKIVSGWIGCGLLALALASCGSSGGSGSTAFNPSGTGPFDRRGNYVEDWADTPSKWKGGDKPGKEAPLDYEDPPVIAKNEQPPESSIPLPSPGEPMPTTTPIVAKKTTSSSSSSSPKPKTSTSTASSSKPKPKTSSGTASSSKPKPKTSTASTAKKKSSSPARYTVRKGDTLSAIASRNGTSVSALQRANGISGSMIRPGQALRIPK